ncbi:MAG: zinc ABC transporter substrate-binding protein [Aquificae bacterium]|nr:zinc ABC transporter substrate-binding protein [Aquificota bacterium]
MRLALILFLSLFLTAFGKPKVYTTIKPIADIISYISGEKVEYLIPPNVSPHIYSVKPQQLKKIQEADLFVYVGNFEHSLEKYITTLPKGKVIEILKIKGLKLIEEEHHHIHPAVWLDPSNGIVIARYFAEKLSQLDPENREEYYKNLKSFEATLKQLKEEGIQKISTLKNKKFISYHYAWVYFTQAFGLEYIGVIERGHGREPTPKQIKKIITLIKKYKIPVIFSAKQFYNKKYVDLIVKYTGVKVVFLDPFGVDKDYIQMMDFNINQVYKNLK